MPRHEIALPDELAALLARSANLQSGVAAAVSDLGPILSADRRPFFPEYTDHGIGHVENVIKTAYGLAADSARAKVTPADATVLVLSCLLHDLAMQIEEAGFVALVSGTSGHRSIPWFGHRHHERPWMDLWADFEGQASRFSGRQNQDMFGSPEPLDPPILASPDRWSRSQRLLIGEFIRRHHGRLAHEIAVHGFPSPFSVAPLRLDARLGAIADLAGLVARSHSMSLRPCVDYVGDTYQDRRTPYACHAAFIMALLRLADYLQLEAERAPGQLLRVTKLQSPLSIGEWKKHEAVTQIHQSGDDREAIHVIAHPDNVRTYLELKQLLEGIQRELDHSWAVLGEVFGPVTELHALGLTIRRVRSNLDDQDAFGRTVSYVPTLAAFEAADADLLKLLVGPLYGDRPEIGVRELVQNATDAVRELHDWLDRHPERRSDLLRMQADQEEDVRVVLEIDAVGNRWLRITDKGKGMTTAIVRHYFLRAGASYRRSDAWKREHEGEAHKARVARSGRFGIGALAAFLLGPEIEVTTRHVDSADGIIFSAAIDTSPIELRRQSNVPVGTTIRVRLADTVWSYLATVHRRWDWYVLDQPVVRRWIQDQPLRRSPSIPAAASSLPRGWYRVSHRDYADIHWTYATRERSPQCCNGIRIPRQSKRGDRMLCARDSGGVELWQPFVSLFDHDGKLPLTLDRMELPGGSRVIGEELAASVLRDVIACAVCTAPEVGLLAPQAAGWTQDGGHPAFWPFSPGRPVYGGRRSFKWFNTNKGFALVEPTTIRENSPERVLLVRPDYPEKTKFKKAALPDASYAVFGVGDDDPHPFRLWPILQVPDALGHRLQLIQVFTTWRWNETPNPQGRTTASNLELVEDSKDAQLYRCKEQRDEKFDLLKLVPWRGGNKLHYMLAEYKIQSFADRAPPSLAARLWRQYVGGVIPFDRNDRRALRKQMWELHPEMRPHIEFWQAEVTR